MELPGTGLYRRFVSRSGEQKQIERGLCKFQRGRYLFISIHTVDRNSCVFISTRIAINPSIAFKNIAFILQKTVKRMQLMPTLVATQWSPWDL